VDRLGSRLHTLPCNDLARAGFIRFQLLFGRLNICVLKKQRQVAISKALKTMKTGFRFTIRDLLWLMVVVGLAVGWWLNDARKYAAYRDLYGNGSFKPHFDALIKRAKPDPALKAEAEELTAIASRQLREDVAQRMEVSRKYNQLKAKADALPLPEPSLFDEWPPEPPWARQK